MSKFSKDDIQDLLKNWNEAKKQIAVLEKKIDKYKVYADNILKDSGKDELKIGKYTLKKKIIEKKTLSKDNVPPEVYKQYARTSCYPVFYISEKGSSDL
jgi:hypothetical protein